MYIYTACSTTLSFQVCVTKHMDVGRDQDFTGIPTVVLDSLRIRLSQLVHSLTALNNDVCKARLPEWPALHKQFNVTLVQLGSVLGSLEDVRVALQEAIVFPTAKFPLNTHAALLTTLLRKKNLPDVEEWIDKGTEMISTNSIDESLDDDFSQWAWEVAEENTQINVTPINLDDTTPATQWTLENAISFMYGNHYDK